MNCKCGRPLPTAGKVIGLRCAACTALARALQAQACGLFNLDDLAEPYYTIAQEKLGGMTR